MKHFKYFGNSAYCYSNSTAMLLASIEENIPPSLIEVVGGIGIGAYALPDSNISFLSNYSGLPDKAISKAMQLLGFEFKEEAQNNPNRPPFDKVKKILKTSPVILGPLDMGFLEYDPNNKNHHGVDHFVLIFEITNNKALLHDPAGFPNVSISLDKLALAWKAESIHYKEGYYRFWASPKRIKKPTDKEIYKNTIKNLQDIYLTGEKYAKSKGKIIDHKAIIFMASNVEKEKLKPFEIAILSGFVFPLGARRANDFSDFFKLYNPRLSDIKAEQSSLLGLCHALTVSQDWEKVTKLLLEFAELEKKFKETILKL